MKAFNTSKSKEKFYEMKQYLVDGAASSFHIPSYREYPICISRGEGAYVYDIDGNKYIDFIMGFGPIILGYSSDAVNEAIINQLPYGTHFSAPTENLYTLSKKLTEIIPSAQKVYYQNSGTEAVMLAFRLARAYTSKNKIIKFEGQYHGWSDEEKVTIDAACIEELGTRETPNKIIHTKGQLTQAADNLILLPWNDLELLKKVLEERADEIAAIITEPFMCDSGPILPKKGYLEGMRELATKHNVVLIFDEVITGFRASLGGAQQYFGVYPDISTFAKAITNGLPFAAVAGRKEIMEAGVHASGTFNGNPLGVAAALKVIEELSKENTYVKLEELSRQLAEGTVKLAHKYGIQLYGNAIGGICILQFGCDDGCEDFRDWLNRCDFNFYDKFVKKLEEYGVRFPSRRGRLFLSASHTVEDIDAALDIIDIVFSELTNNNKY